MKRQLFLAGGIVVGLFLLTAPAFATDLSGQVMDQVNQGARAGGLGMAQDPRLIAASLIKVLLATVGTVFFVLMLLAAYWLITARGEEEKEKKALDTIRRSVIGLIIILVSYGIVTFVGNKVQDAVNLELDSNNPALRAFDEAN